jgi:cell wall-associated NlpC family hydrolase
MFNNHTFRNLLMALALLQLTTVWAVEADSSIVTDTSGGAISLSANDATQSGETSGTTTPVAAKNLLQYALSFDGVAYRRGGTREEIGFDCSGFVRHVFDHVESVALPHSANAISKLGKVVSKAELIPGDLVFFRRTKKIITHVGIYLGDNQFVHASSHRTGRVMISKLADRYWAKHFTFGRRLDLPVKE